MERALRGSGVAVRIAVRLVAAILVAAPVVAVDMFWAGNSAAQPDARPLTIVKDDVTGVQLGVPLTIVTAPTSDRWGRNWESADKRLSIDTLNFGRDRTIADIYYYLRGKSGRVPNETVSRLGNDRFVLEGVDLGKGGPNNFFHVEGRSSATGEVRGLSIVYDERSRAELDATVRRVIASFDPFPTVVAHGNPGPPFAQPAADLLAMVNDDATGVRLAIPLALVNPPVDDKWGQNWESADKRLSINSLNFGRGRTIGEIYDYLRSKPGRIPNDAVSRVGGDRFVLEGEDIGRDGPNNLFHVEGRASFAGEVRGFSIVYDARSRADLDGVVRRMIASFDPFPTVVARDDPTPPVVPPKESHLAPVAPVNPPAIAPRPPPSSPPVAGLDFIKRVALVLGNGQYAAVNPLTNPPNDASAVGGALRALGFDVVQGIDRDKRGMELTLREFAGKVGQADLAVFFYAGHGLQVANENYLVPIDARLETENDLDLEMIKVSMIMKLMHSSANIVLLDACRDNPLARRLQRSLGGTRSIEVSQGLAQIRKTGIETLIEFSTAADEIADDGAGKDSPFTEALLTHIFSPGVDFQLMMRDVRRDVIKATRGEQVPAEYGSLTGKIVLLPLPRPGTPPIGGSEFQPVLDGGLR
jgi:hypothetical protein